ncbi:hypothetical protein E2C01_039229 [Portunus trituberculatus]|uniref:Uncharacterized protein n=1 Tax=Portunus trituberculatus TaxID=210409 RepID=A0A5B7FJ35_PORTR|nr:hypothetical protein [Portunus trituberculatus]
MAWPRVTLHDSLFLEQENRMCPAIGHYRVPLKGAADPAGEEGRQKDEEEEEEEENWEEGD